MKKMMMSLMLTLSCFSFTAKINAHDSESYFENEIGEINPFNLKSSWNLCDQEDNKYLFENSQNYDVELDIVVGRAFPKVVTLDQIQQEVENLLVVDPLYPQWIAYALNMSEEEFNRKEEDEDDDFSVGFNKEDFINKDLTPFTKIQIEGITWLNITYTSPVIVTTFSSSGADSILEYSRKSTFVCIIDNQLYLAEFTAPLTSYNDYEEGFLESMVHISTYINEINE